MNSERNAPGENSLEPQGTASEERTLDKLVRSSCVLLVGVEQFDPNWGSPGPYPFDYRPNTKFATKTDGLTRSSYFLQRVARSIFADDRRRHKDLAGAGGTNGVRVEAVELLACTEAVTGGAMAIIHLSLPHSRDAAIAALTALRSISTPSKVDDTADAVLNALKIAEVPQLREGQQTFTIAFATFASDRASSSTINGWSLHEQDLWLLASAAPEFPAVGSLRCMAGVDPVPLSDSWSALVLRDGASFVGRHKDLDTNSNNFYPNGEVLAKSVYADALALGWIQKLGLDALYNELSNVNDPADDRHALSVFTRRFINFRHRFLWGRISTHGHPCALLEQFQTQHEIPRERQELEAELDSDLRYAQRSAAERSSLMLELLAVVGLPVGILQVLEASRPEALLIPFTFFLAWLYFRRADIRELVASFSDRQA